MWGFQGDVNIRKAKIPQGVIRKEKTKRGYILAEGEFTGHAHVITDECEVYEKNGLLYIKNDSPVEIKHEEHKTVTLPIGKWEVGIAEEYDHFAEEAKRVRD